MVFRTVGAAVAALRDSAGAGRPVRSDSNAFRRCAICRCADDRACMVQGQPCGWSARYEGVCTACSRIGALVELALGWERVRIVVDGRALGEFACTAAGLQSFASQALDALRYLGDEAAAGRVQVEIYRSEGTLGVRTDVYRAGLDEGLQRGRMPWVS